jgi:hypothetical protein|tara:strand:+ start:145 stop:732 length:588 start_codon:yes stop_codon:yes gene_type:complete
MKCNIHIAKLILITFFVILFGTIIGATEYTYEVALIQTILLYLYSYWGHVFAHNVSQEYPINIINTHISIHHNESTYYSREFNLLMESINNFAGFFVLIIIQYLTGVKILSNRIIFYSVFLYIGLHIFYYSITKNNYHVQHHKTPEFNYSPELLDIIFRTKYNNDYDNELSMTYELIPVVVSYYLVCSLIANRVL